MEVDLLNKYIESMEWDSRNYPFYKEAVKKSTLMSEGVKLRILDSLDSLFESGDLDFHKLAFLFFMIYYLSEEGIILLLRKEIFTFINDTPIPYDSNLGVLDSYIIPTTYEDFYKNILSIPDTNKLGILNLIGLKSSQYNALYKSLKQSDEASFVKILYEADIDITKASKFAQVISLFTTSHKNAIGTLVENYLFTKPRPIATYITKGVSEVFKSHQFDIFDFFVEYFGFVKSVYKAIAGVTLVPRIRQEIDDMYSHLSPLLEPFPTLADNSDEINTLDFVRLLNVRADDISIKEPASSCTDTQVKEEDVGIFEETEEIQQEEVLITNDNVDDQPEPSRYKHLPIPFSSNYRGKMAALADRLCVSDPKFLEENSKEAFVYFMCGPEHHCMMKQNVEVVWRDTWKTHKYLLSTLYQRIGTYTLPEGTVETIVNCTKFEGSRSTTVQVSTYKNNGWYNNSDSVRTREKIANHIGVLDAIIDEIFPKK